MDKHVRQIVEGLEGNAEEARDRAFFKLLDLCKSGYKTSNLPPGIRAEVLSTYAEQKKRLFPAQHSEGVSWVAEEGYAELRAGAAVILDVLRYFPGSDTVSQLEEALAYDDPRLKFFAITSLLHLGIEVSPRDVFHVASSAEMRNWLYEALHEMGKASLYPHDLSAQEAFAESNLAEWLSYPTELGTSPDEMELMDVVNIGAPDRPLDYYLFRFRTFPPHWAAQDGWMAGLAGPFSRAEAPTTQGQGYTFSKLESWDARTPEEHIEDTLNFLTDWYDRAARRN